MGGYDFIGISGIGGDMGFTYMRSPKWAIVETIWTIDLGGTMDGCDLIGVLLSAILR